MLNGSIGFFDSEVRWVVPITSAENLLQLTPYSGGGQVSSAYLIMFMKR